MSLMKRLFVVIVILLAAVVAYYAVTTNWQRYSEPLTATSTPEALVGYSSPRMGIAFEYPNTYSLVERDEGTGEREWRTIVLVDKVAAANVPEGGEGPPAITISDFPNVEGLALETWIKGDARSNWKLADGDGALGSTTVDGKPALTYRHTGLYEATVVALAYNDKIYFFSVQWLTPEDKIRKDFEKLLETVIVTP